MNHIISKSSYLNTLLMVSIALATPSLYAVTVHEDLAIGAPTHHRSLTVHGHTNLEGDAAVGGENNLQRFKVWGEATISGNTTVNEDGNCKRMFGMINNFNPHKHQLAITFASTAEGAHGAELELILGSVGHSEGNQTITTHASNVFIHPNNTDNCLDIGGIVRIDEIHGDTSIDSAFQMDLVFRKAENNDMCVGLAKYIDDSPDSFYTQPEFIDAGCLFYTITSANLASAGLTFTHDPLFPTLTSGVQTIIESLTNNPLTQEEIAFELLRIDGSEFYFEIFLSLPTDTQLAILAEILHDLNS